MDNLLEQLLQQEQELQFLSFNESDAWQIGCQLVERAQKEALPIAIDITRGSHQLFHASLRGATSDNDEWIKRKVRVVYRFGHSSFYVGQLLKSKGKRLEDAFLIPESEYAAHGGCFPILVRNTGLIGTITVSGLPQEGDHKLVVEGIRDYLRQRK